MANLLASVIPGSQYLKERKIKLFDLNKESQGLLKWMVNCLITPGLQEGNKIFGLLVMDGVKTGWAS